MSKSTNMVSIIQFLRMNLVNEERSPFYKTIVIFTPTLSQILIQTSSCSAHHILSLNANPLHPKACHEGRCSAGGNEILSTISLCLGTLLPIQEANYTK